MHLFFRKAFLVAASFIWLAGCGKSAMQCTVVGNVTYRNQPVAHGEILLSDSTGSDPTAFGTIENGKYRLRCTPGTKRIRITASKETGKIIDGAMGVKYAERMDLIPPQYNSASTLDRTIEPTSDCVLDFQLE